MKKVIALALTLAMVLALGVTAFAASMTLKDEYEVGETVNFTIEVLAGEEITKIYDSSNLITFDTPRVADGTNGTFWTVNGKLNSKGLTRIVVEYTNVNGDPDVLDDLKVIEIVDATPSQAGEDYLTFGVGSLKEIADEKAFVEAKYGNSSVILDLYDSDNSDPANEVYVYFDGISAEVYNAAAKLNPEKIVIWGEDATITLYRGDYTKLTVKKDIEINAMVTVSDVLLDSKGKDMNNRVLTALGNNNADPFYVTIDSTNLTDVAANPELSIDLTSDEFTQWCKTNNCKAMDIYAFDASDDTVALVAEDVSVNNLFDNVVEMPTLETATYVFVDAGNSATGSANVKPNTNTGANDMVAVAVVFATIALAAGVSKKVR